MTATRRSRSSIIGGWAGVALITTAALAGCAGTSPTPTAGQSLPATVGDLGGVSGVGQTAMPPWPLPADAAARAAAAGMPMGPMGTAEHYHPELKILVDGKPIDIPANIGVDPASGRMSAVHTHTPDGVIHIEAAQTGQSFTLGQLFTQWNVQLGPDQFGGLGSANGGKLTVTVNGQPWSGNPATLRLAPDQQIVLTYTSGR